MMIQMFQQQASGHRSTFNYCPIWAENTSLTPPPFSEVPVRSQEMER